jgi:hypothetical protein
MREDRKMPLRRPKRIWKDIIKIDLQEDVWAEVGTGGGLL